VAEPVPAVRPAGPAGLPRGLRIVALAATLALVAVVIDARSRPPPAEPVVLLPVPEAVPQRPAPAFVPRPAPPPAAEPAAGVEALPGTPRPTETSPPTTAPAEPTAPATRARPAEGAFPSPSPPAAAEPVTATPAEPPRPPPAPTSSAGPTVRDGVLAYQAGDYARAESIWRPLAEAGNARARFHLGALYLEGRLGPPDPEAAYRWLALAAEAGQAAAAPLRDQAAARLPPERLATIRAELGLLP
jgi:hypothetical protein